MSLADKCIVVTGSASGIGEATVALLKQRGATVVGFDRTERTDNVAEFHQIELSDFSSGKVSIDAAVAGFTGPADGLCNIAGVPPRGGDSADVLRINFIGLRRFTEAMVPKLTDGASIVNMASLAGFGWQEHVDKVRACLALDDDADLKAFCEEYDIGHPYGYFFSKECLVVWTKQNCRRWADRGIRMNTVSPGPIETPIYEAFLEAFGERAKRNIDRVRRPGRAEEVAPLVAFLLGDESGWINGANIPVDAGMEAILWSDVFEFGSA